MSEILNLFLLALLGSIIALAGGVIFLYNRRLARVLEAYAIPFAAGVLLTVAILGLAPESVDVIGESAFLVILLSFLGSFLFENVLFQFHHHDEHARHEHDIRQSVPMVIFGDTLHNFIDGIAIGASFLLSPGLGFITAFSTFLHEIPHEIGDFGIMLKAKWSRKNILVINIISASMTIVGAFLLYFSNMSEWVIGVMLAVSAGVFLYLGAIDFLPHVVEHTNGKTKKFAVIPLILGVIIMAVVLLLTPHEHDNEESGEHDRSFNQTSELQGL